MDPVGIGAVAAVLLAGTAAGVWRNRTSGRLRDVVAVDNGRKLSDPAASLAPTQNRAGEGAAGRALATEAPVDSGDKLSDPGAWLAPTQNRAGEDGGPERGPERGLPLDSAVLAGLGFVPGDGATLLQFSSAYCAPCRAVSRVSSEVAGEIPGVRHVEVDAEEHLDAVKALGIWRTPTLLVLDREGRVVKRATGVPGKPQLIAAVRETL